MKLNERIGIYESIEEYRKRPLIVYATSPREGVAAILASDAVRYLIDQVDQIKDSKSVDVLIHSSGGDALAAWKLMSILRERFKNVAVLVPFMAFSAATIFALGADEIVMHPHASLGPIDPQIQVKDRSFSYEDVGAFLRFLEEEGGFTEQTHLSTLVERIFAAVDPLVIGAAKRASELSSSVGERLLRMHMSDSAGRDAARQIAENLNKSFFAHGDAVSRTRARELQLKIAKDDKELEALMWQAYLGLESYMLLKEPFHPMLYFLRDEAARDSLKPTPALQLPQNAPPELVQQIWNAVAQQAIQALQAEAPRVRYENINALIESPRLGFEHFTCGEVSAFRVPGGDLKVEGINTSIGWRGCDIRHELVDPPDGGADRHSQQSSISTPNEDPLAAGAES